MIFRPSRRVSPDVPVARGRDADVFPDGPGRVLRRYRDPDRSAEVEAAAMRHLRAHGYPVPEVVDAQGPDLLMERIEGPTMLEDLARRPWRGPAHARTLADLHHRLHRLPVPDGLRARFGGGPALLHLDLHPDNVLLGPRGPVVIDWANAALGPPEADAAQTWVILATSEVPATGARRTLLGAGRAAFLALLLARLDRGAASAWLPVVAAARCRDRNVTDHERAAIELLVARVVAGGRET